MADQQETAFSLGRASVLLEPGTGKSRFWVDAATLRPASQRRLVLRFQGQHGAVEIEMARVAFWRMASLFHERATAADFGEATEPAKPRRGKRR
jgi:hypothetical protein